MEYMKKLMTSFWKYLVDNWPVIVKALIAVWFFFSGIHLFIFAIFSLTILDVVTGVTAAYKRKEPITSRKLRTGLLEKFLLYMVLLLAVFTLDIVMKHIIPIDAYYLSGLISFLISTYEVTSIMENVLTINPNMPFISSLVRVFQTMNQKTIDSMQKKIDGMADNITQFKVNAVISDELAASKTEEITHLKEDAVTQFNDTKVANDAADIISHNKDDEITQLKADAVEVFNDTKDANDKADVISHGKDVEITQLKTEIMERLKTLFSNL